MKVIPIIGEISDTSYSEFIANVKNAGDEPKEIWMDTIGGSVFRGQQIKNYISENQNIFEAIRNLGDVASIGASIFLAMPFEKRFFDMSLGSALIHFPMWDAKGMYNSNELERTTLELKKLNLELATDISIQTGVEIEVVKSIMAKDKPMSLDELNTLKFANILNSDNITKREIKAVAIYENNLNNTNMTNEEVKAQLGEQKSMLEKILALFKPKIVAVMLTDANGASIEFPEVPEGSMPQVGDKVSAPDGEVVMADGYTYVIAGGVLTEIKEPEVAPTEDVEALKAELAAMKAENETLKASTAQMNEIKAQVVALQGKIKSQMIDLDPEEKTEKVEPAKFTYNGRKK